MSPLKLQATRVHLLESILNAPCRPLYDAILYLIQWSATATLVENSSSRGIISEGAGKEVEGPEPTVCEKQRKTSYVP
jgi:hypothetical protein